MALNKDLIMLDFYEGKSIPKSKNSQEIPRLNQDKSNAKGDKSKIKKAQISRIKGEIPIMFCFDERYITPAAVCFLSLLENANPSYFYSLFVLHNDVLKSSQNRLLSIISRFKNAQINFIDMKGKFEDLFASFKTKGHYSKEMLYKILCPQIFPQFERILITDVDVVFAGDITKAWLEFSKSDEICAFTTPPPREVFEILGWTKWLNEIYAEFSENEREKLLNGGGAGFLIFNLTKMRRENTQQKFLACLYKNAQKLTQAEQDVINLILQPKVAWLPLKTMLCSYVYKAYQNRRDLLDSDKLNALQTPVQIHYATHIKPWNNPKFHAFAFVVLLFSTNAVFLRFYGYSYQRKARNSKHKMHDF